MSVYPQGTHRSILKAQELIDDALTSPDTDPTSHPSPPQTRGGSPEESKVDTPFSAISSSHRAISPSASRLRKRHSDISLPTTSQTKATPTLSLPTSILHAHPSSSVLSHKGSAPVTMTTTISESSRYVPTEAIATTSRNLSCAGGNPDKPVGANPVRPVPRAWKIPQENESASLPITTTTTSTGTRSSAPPLYSYAKSLSRGNEVAPPPPQAPPTATPHSATLVTPLPQEEPPAQLTVDINSKLPRQQRHPSTPEPISVAADASEEAIPTRKHSRSKSDPQVSASDHDPPLQSSQPESPNSLRLPDGHTHFSPTMPTIESPSVTDEAKDLLLNVPPRPIASSKVPIGAEKAAAALAAAASTKNAPGPSSTAPGPNVSSAIGASAQGGGDRLAVGEGVPRARNVAVILPTQVGMVWWVFLCNDDLAVPHFLHTHTHTAPAAAHLSTCALSFNGIQLKHDL